jgi:hypothetical protein
MGFDEKEVRMMLGDLDTMNFDALNPTEDAEIANENAKSHAESPTNESSDSDEPKLKPILVTDALGFKHIPGEYKADLVEFQAQAESTGKVGAEAFCVLIRQLLNGMTSEN